jgi:hypothetical protein
MGQLNTCSAGAAGASPPGPPGPMSGFMGVDAPSGDAGSAGSRVESGTMVTLPAQDASTVRTSATAMNFKVALLQSPRMGAMLGAGSPERQGSFGGLNPKGQRLCDDDLFKAWAAPALNRGDVEPHSRDRRRAVDCARRVRWQGRFQNKCVLVRLINETTISPTRSLFGTTAVLRLGLAKEVHTECDRVIDSRSEENEGKSYCAGHVPSDSDHR